MKEHLKTLKELRSQKKQGLLSEKDFNNKKLDISPSVGVWFYNGQFGPQENLLSLEVAELIELEPEGKHFVWREGMSGWEDPRIHAQIKEALNLLEEEKQRTENPESAKIQSRTIQPSSQPDCPEQSPSETEDLVRNLENEVGALKNLLSRMMEKQDALHKSFEAIRNMPAARPNGTPHQTVPAEAQRQPIQTNSGGNVVTFFDGKIENHKVTVTSEALFITSDNFGVLDSFSFKTAEITQGRAIKAEGRLISVNSMKPKSGNDLNEKVQNALKVLKRADAVIPLSVVKLISCLLLALIFLMTPWMHIESVHWNDEYGRHGNSAIYNWFVVLFKTGISGLFMLTPGYLYFRKLYAMYHPDGVMSGAHAFMAKIRGVEERIVDFYNKKSLDFFDEIMEAVSTYHQTGVIRTFKQSGSSTKGSDTPKEWTARGNSEPMFFLCIFINMLGFVCALSSSGHQSQGIIILGIVIVIVSGILGIRQKSLAVVFFSATDVVILLSYMNDLQSLNRIMNTPY